MSARIEWFSPNDPHPPCGHLLPLPWAKGLRAEKLWCL
jgi:hypothetical protein